jgi:hypothetical protein
MVGDYKSRPYLSIRKPKKPELYPMRTRTLFLCLVLLCSQLAIGQDLSPRKAYVNLYAKMAVKEMKRTGIPASITLAQGILESGNGQSRLATEGNNHFGIKCHEDWKGKTMFVDDDKPNECFRVYRNPVQSFKDHSAFLASRSRYDDLFNLDPRDFKTWASGLKAAGYATSPTYAEKLIRIIEAEELYRFDAQVIKPAKRGTKAHPRYKMTPAGAGYVLLEEGESLEQLAFDLGRKTPQILRFNEVHMTWDPVPGDRVYVTPKKTDTARKLRKISTCRLASGEDPWTIAQRYGITLKSLYDLNGWPVGHQPEAGSLIRVQGPKLAEPISGAK